MLALAPKIANRLKRGDKRKTRLDRIAMHHDIASQDEISRIRKWKLNVNT